MSEEPTSLGELHERYALSIDHQLALNAARRRLNEEFAQAFNPETVERFLAGSYDQFAAGARFPHFVHVLAERYARQRLIAFGQVEHFLNAGKPIVLFVCESNDLLSPMARGLLAKRARNEALAWSAGVNPAVGMKEGVEAVMNSKGISFADEFPKPIAPEMLTAATDIVLFGRLTAVPVLPGRRYFEAEAPTVRSSDRSEVEAIAAWLDDSVAQFLAKA